MAAKLTHEELCPDSYKDEWGNLATFIQCLKEQTVIQIAEVQAYKNKVSAGPLVWWPMQFQMRIIEFTDEWQATKEQRCAMFKDVGCIILATALMTGGYDAKPGPDREAAVHRRGGLLRRAMDYWANSAELTYPGGQEPADLYEKLLDDEFWLTQDGDPSDLIVFSDFAQAVKAPHTIRNRGSVAYAGSGKV